MANPSLELANMSAENSKFRILCFIPAKNCQGSLTGLLANFTPEVLSYIDEILLVDNGSSDQTVHVAKEELAKLSGVKATILQNSRNYGLGGSHKIAFLYAFEHGLDYVMVLHGDNSVNVQDALPLLRNHTYLKYEAALSSRLSSGRRVNYPWHRLFFNRIVSFIATLITRTKISDFTGGGLNFYRTSAFITKFANPIKRYSNDVAFPQYMTLFAAYHRYRMIFFPVNHTERDIKPRDKLISQFGKAILLLLRYFIAPGKTIDHDVFGTFFGHNYRRIKVSERETSSDVEIKNTTPQGPPVPVKPQPIERPVASDVPAVIDESFNFIDLSRLKISDDYEKSSSSVSLPVVESVEHFSDSHLHLTMKLDVELAISRGLRASFLRLFKVYGPEKISLDLNADRVLRSKQLHEFLYFCKDFGLDVQLASMSASNDLLWKQYAPLVRSLILSHEFGSSSREDFFQLIEKISPLNRNLKINVLTNHSKFFHSYGLYELLLKSNLVNSLRLQPYLSGPGISKPSDHLELLRKSFSSVQKKPAHGLYREHFGFDPEATVSQSQAFNAAKEFGFSHMKSQGTDVKFQQVHMDHKGSLFLVRDNESLPIGTVFDEASGWLSNIHSTVEKV